LDEDTKQLDEYEPEFVRNLKGLAKNEYEFQFSKKTLAKNEYAIQFSEQAPRRERVLYRWSLDRWRGGGGVEEAKRNNSSGYTEMKGGH
jgi:hypothetical protein